MTPSCRAGRSAARARAAWSGQLAARLIAVAAVAAAAGIIITTAATLLPAALLRRLPLAQQLAQE